MRDMRSRQLLPAVLLLVSVTAALSQSSLFVVARDGTPADVRAALAAGANLEAHDEIGWTPLMIAAGSNDNPEVVQALLVAGANLEARNEDGWTALMHAAEGSDNPEVVQALLVAGANLEARNEDGWTALMRAAAFNDTPEVIRVLLSAGDKESLHHLRVVATLRCMHQC